MTADLHLLRAEDKDPKALTKKETTINWDLPERCNLKLTLFETRKSPPVLRVSFLEFFPKI
jgi:hypothetical protein